MRVEVKSTRFVEVKKAALKRVAHCEANNLCCYCLQPREGKIVRGDHERCARKNYRDIESGAKTDEEIVAEGLWLPQGTPGRKRRQPAEIGS